MNYKICMVLLLVLSGCSTSREVTIEGFGLLGITDMATDNIMPTVGPEFAGNTEIPLQGLTSIPLTGAYSQGGILSAAKIHIKGTTDAIIVIERGVSGNHGVNVPTALEKILKPTSHPFGNLTIQGGDIMREHVEN